MLSDHPENYQPRNREAITLGLDDGPNASGDAELGRHHPPIVLLTGTGIIRATARYKILAVFGFA